MHEQKSTYDKLNQLERQIMKQNIEMKKETTQIQE